MLFQWRSRLLKQYAEGYIVVSFETVNEARLIAKARFDIEYPAPTTDPFNDDWGDWEEYNKNKAKFHSDISPEPEIIDDGCIFISGSE
jgi:hypothetical protein